MRKGVKGSDFAPLFASFFLKGSDFTPLFASFFLKSSNENRRQARLERELTTHRDTAIDKGITVEQRRLNVVVILIATVGTDGVTVSSRFIDGNTCGR